MKDTCIFKRVMTIMLAVVMVISMLACDVGVSYAASTFTRVTPFNIKVDGKTVKNRTYNHNNRFKDWIVLDGLDISAWQDSDTDFNKIKAAGADYVILRISGSYYGSGDQYDDVNFLTFYKNAKAAGLMVGAYVFSQATTTAEAEQEVEYAVNLLKSYGIKPSDLDLPVYMDYEFSGGSDGRLTKLQKKLGSGKFKTRATNCVEAFCTKMKALGYNTGLYANTSFLNSSCDGAGLGEKYDIWCAQYYTECEFTGTYDMWQYSSSAVISGVTGTSTADVNFWYLDKNRTSSASNDVANCVATNQAANATQKYTGNKLTPEYTLSLNGTTLTKGTDYTVAYIDNVDIGTGYAIIRGLGDYCGYKLIPFTITDQANDATDIVVTPDIEKGFDIVKNIGLTNFKTSDGAYGIKLSENAKKIGLTLTDTKLKGVVKGMTAAALKSLVSVDEEYEGYSIAAINGTLDHPIEDDAALATGNLLVVYNEEGTAVASVKITVDGDASITFSTAKYTYNSSSAGAKKPKVTVQLGDWVVADNINASNKRVNIKYPSGRKLPGKYTVTVTGVAGSGLEGTYKAAFNIVVKPISISSLKGGTRTITVKWKKQASKYVSGYQLQYCLYKDMPSEYVGTKKITSYKTVSKKLSTNYAGKYYARIRTYKTISGKKYYSSWSAVKAVTVK